MRKALFPLFVALSFAQSDPCKNLNLEKNAPLKGLPYKVVSKREVGGLCEVVIELKDQLIPLYTNGRVLISGEAWVDKRPITQEHLKEIREKIMRERLKTLNAFAVAQYKPEKWNGRWFYFVADPECPYSNYVKKRVKELSDKTGWGIKLVFLPLPFHRGSLQKVKAFVCAKKTFSDYLADNYGNKTDCPEAAKFDGVLKKLSFLRATPTFVVPLSGGVRVVVGTNLKALGEIFQKIDEKSD